MQTDIHAAKRHLKRECTKMAELIAVHPDPVYKKTRNSFETLSRSIVSQQLSNKAARTIYLRFRGLFDVATPKPRDVLAKSIDELRTAGLSTNKARFLHALAEAYEDGTVAPRKFARMSNEELREHLIAVKGLGPWTVDMFCMFGLARPDILPVGDLAIRNAMRQTFGLRELPKPAEMERIAAPWQPYRSIACHYLWCTIDSLP